MPPGADRDRRELDVLLKRGPAFLIYKGLQDPAAERDYAASPRDRQAVGRRRSAVQGHLGIMALLQPGSPDAPARDRAEELVALAQRSGDELIYSRSHTLPLVDGVFSRRVPRTLTDGHEGIRHYHPERHGRLAAEFGGHDPGVCANTVAGLALAQMGRIPRQPPPSNAAYRWRVAQSSEQPGIRMMKRDDGVSNNRESACASAARITRIEIADRFKLPPQRSIAVFMAGMARAHGEALADGRNAMEAEYVRTSMTGPLPQYYACRRGVRLAAGAGCVRAGAARTDLGLRR